MPTHSRFFFFALILALFLLPTLAPAQTSAAPIENPKANPQDEMVLFDFDGGTFDGWTLSGDCWDKQPATAKTFVDRQGRSVVAGIVGAGYLTTLHPTLGNAATGKAVSRDFTISKPFLNFKIGGGRYPNQACLNLVVDGKIVRTETGSDSPDLVPASWDVSLLAGKTAHLEVVDNTASQNRGYIMVDDCRLSSFHTFGIREGWSNSISWTDADGKRIALTDQQIHFLRVSIA